MTMHMSTIKDLIKYHRAMENRAKNTVSMVGHYDAVQTLRHCVEIPSYVTGPFSRQWAMEALAEIMSEAAKREWTLGNEADNEQDRDAHEATHGLLINMAGQFIEAAIR